MPTLSTPKSLLLALMLLILTANQVWANVPVAKDAYAVFDLREKHWQQGKSFPLRGYWLFKANSFVSESPENKSDWTPMNVPGSWDLVYSKGPEETRPLPPKGYGTYFVRILVPKDQRETYLYLPDMASAYELWSWGEKLGGNGTIATKEAFENPAYVPKVYTLTPRDGVVDLYIKTSNFHYQWGGLWYAPLITDSSGLFQLRDRPLIRAVSGGTILLSAAIFCLFLYLSRKQDKKILFFSLFCFAIAIRRLCIDERILYLMPYFDWHTLQAAENLSMYVMMPLFLAYFRHAFSEHTPKWLPIAGTLIILPFCLMVLVTSVEVYTSLNRPFQASILIFAPFVVYYWYQALKDRAPSAKTFGASLLIFLLTVLNDILNYNYIIQTTNLMHMGALAFVLFQVAALLQRYLKNFKKIELLSESLTAQNEALLRMDKFKDDFLASTSHELRTPLHGIAGLAKTLKQEAPKLSPDSRNRVRLIESTAKRLGHLVNDILDISSMKHGKLELQQKPTFLRPLVESTIQSLRPLVESDAVALEYLISDDANNVIADEQRLQQILFNLIGNAIKFTAKGSILVEAHKQGEQVTIWIKDTGKGIPKDKLQTILEPYETLDNHTSEIRGTGLGLPITNMLVALHNGKLSIESVPGEGTQVQFTLPLADQVPNLVVEEASDYENEAHSGHISAIATTDEDFANSQIENNLTQGALVFFADDEEVNRSLVAGQLSEAGYQIKTFANGQALLDQLAHETPELILLDWMMPEKSGLEICQRIRESYDRYQLPVMMLTAKHQVSDIVQALRLGANDYLTKPYYEQELLARVHSQLSVKRLFVTTHQNELLRHEITMQEQAQEQLNLSNQRLTNALNISPECVLLLDEDLDIEFINEPARKLMAVEGELEKETGIANYIDTQSLTRLKQAINDKSTTTDLVLASSQESIHTTIGLAENEDDQHIILLLNPSLEEAESNQDEPITGSLLSGLTQELAENRQRMIHIEETLKQLTQTSDAVVTEPAMDEDPNELLVKTLRLALITWERYTHQTKAELAEKSRCWRVYLDGTSAKTRTLDKYLSVKTLPAKPRWRAVIKTANYVLDHCELSEEDQSQLSELIGKLNQAYS